MIKSFKHAGLEKYFTKGTLRGIQPAHARALDMRLRALDLAKGPEDVKGYPGWKVHRLKGDRKHQWAMWVSGNWRLTWEFVDGNVERLDYEDYHGD